MSTGVQTWSGDVVIIGAGIIGLATAREILTRRPSTRLMVLEMEDKIAQHQTGHNSGVIHAGIYYKPGTLKASMCVSGAARMIKYCDEHGIAYDLCGKLIVATDADELPRLEELERRAAANGVPGVRMVDAAELREIEPHCSGIRALWSPATGIVDYGQVAQSYATEIEAMGGEIRTRHRVTDLTRRSGRTFVSTTMGDVETVNVVACAGIYSDRVARMSGGTARPTIAPFRGDYYILRAEKRSLVRTNIYPVPDPRFPFLGVHFTPRINGDVWLGPNAVLAFSRTGYRFRDVDARDMAALFSNRGFQIFARKNWRTGLEEMRRDLSKSRFLASLQRYIPELTSDDIVRGPSGVRAQALNRDGTMVDDFVIDQTPGILHVRNAPSPAATSSLEIGRRIVDTLASERPEYSAP